MYSTIIARLAVAPMYSGTGYARCIAHDTHTLYTYRVGDEARESCAVRAAARLLAVGLAAVDDVAHECLALQEVC